MLKELICIDENENNEMQKIIEPIKESYYNGDFKYEYVFCNINNIYGNIFNDVKYFNETIVLKVRVFEDNKYYRCLGYYILEDETGKLYITSYFKAMSKKEKDNYLKMYAKYKEATGNDTFYCPLFYATYKVVDENSVRIDNYRNGFTENDLKILLSENCINYINNLGGKYDIGYIISKM